MIKDNSTQKVTIKTVKFITKKPKDVDYSKYPYFLKVADDFVQKFYDNAVIIDPLAYKELCSDTKTHSTLGDMLVFSVRDYTVAKSEKNPKIKEKCANKLLSWLTMAQGENMIKEGEATKQKIVGYEQQIRQLKDETEQLRKKLILAEKENSDLHNSLDKFGGRTNVVEG